MYIRKQIDDQYLLASRHIKIDYTVSKLILQADIKELYHSNSALSRLDDDKYFIKWEVSFGELIDMPGERDDNWFFFYPEQPIHAIVAPPYQWRKGIEIRQQLPPLVAKVAIRPDTKNFLEAFILVMCRSDTLLEVNGTTFVEDSRPRPRPNKNIQVKGPLSISDDTQYDINWPGLRKDIKVYVTSNFGRVDNSTVQLHNGKGSFTFIPPKSTWSTAEVNISSAHCLLKTINITKS